MTRTDFAIHTVRGRCTTLPGGRFGFDRGWAPQGQGRVTIPLAEYEALHANLAPNPDFETNAAGWFSIRAVARVTGDAIAGAYGRVTGQAGDGGFFVYTDVSVEQGRAYDVVLERTRTTVANKWGQLTIEWRDAAWNVLSRVFSPTARLFTYWEERFALNDLMPPPGAIAMRIEMRVHNTAIAPGYPPLTGDRLEVDGLSVREQVLKPGQKQPVLLVAETWNGYSDGLGALELEGAGTTLGTATWPQPVFDEHYLPDFGDTVSDVQTRPWYVWPRDVLKDRVAGTATITLVTLEAMMQDAVNLSGADILPLRSSPSIGYLGRMLMQLAPLVGLRVFVPVDRDATITFEPEAWEQGQSLWSWFDRMRNRAGYIYELDATLNSIAFRPATRWAFNVPPNTLLEHATVVGPASAEGIEYADALTIEWEWIASTGDQRQRETVLASSLRSWAQVTRHVTQTRPGPPIPGVAQRIVDNLAAARNATTYLAPLNAGHTLYPLGQGASELQRTEYDFDGQTARITILERDAA